MRNRRLLILLLFLLLVGCQSDASELATIDAPAPTVAPLFGASTASPLTDGVEPVAAEGDPGPSGFLIQVNTDLNRRPISPDIYGMSGVDSQTIRAAGVTVNSWGGDTASRYNFDLGYAWNTGVEGSYRNAGPGEGRTDAAADFIRRTQAAGAATRLTVPTLGWVARDADPETCSFPLPDGGCGDAGGANCDQPGPVADPTLANVPSTPEMVAAWVGELVDQGLTPDFIAMDNEPERWGVTHYDVHPDCPTYEEILENYLAYATALRDVAPQAQFMGPVMCCWYSFWGTAPGPARGQYEEFLPWFLDQVRAHDAEVGRRTLDILDVRFFPQGDIDNQEIDAETAARRLRSTRSLWDRNYTDESWIQSPIALIPLLRGYVNANYPGTKIGISGWNFGGDESMNGALAIADALGIFGLYGVDVAGYWRFPPANSPGFFAFQMFGNYDGAGSRFGDIGVQAASANVERVSSFAALDSETGALHLLLVHKDPAAALPVTITLDGYDAAEQVTRHRYSEAFPTSIARSEITARDNVIGLELPPYSITLLVLTPAG